MDVALIKKTQEIFGYGEIQLKLLSSDDLPFTLQWRNEFREWFNSTNMVSFEEHSQWYKNYLAKENDLVFLVQDKHGNRVGQAAVYNIDWQEKSGEFGRFLVNPDFAGKGYMGKSVQAMLQFCEDRLKLHSLYLQVKPHNERAIHIYKKAGFTVEASPEGQNLMMSHVFSTA